MRRFSSHLTSRWKLVLLAGIPGALLVPQLAHAQDAADPLEMATTAVTGVNFVWTLIAGFLVFFMQAGFALVEAGLARRRNTVNILAKNFMDFTIGGIAFWAFGFAIMFGGSGLAPGLDSGNDFFGTSGFFLSGAAYSDDTAMLWFFQMVFAATAATIVSGGMAERTRINAYLAYSFLISAIVYPVYGHWVWGGGWLSQLDLGSGALDFAGSGVVHAVGGISALIGAALVGPRIGKYAKDGSTRPMPGHSIPLVVLGTFILFFGWFGFNPGSTLNGTDTRIAMIAVTTFLAGAAGAIVGFYYSFARTGKADVSLACNGALAGLVAITAPCAFVAPWAALVIGAVGAGVMIVSLSVVDRMLKIDDPVGAFSVHGAAGIWGVLALGIFADGSYNGVSGLITGDVGQLAAQVVSVIALVAWTLIASGAVFLVIRMAIGLRVSKADEMAGLDVTEMGMEAYPADEPAEVAAAASA
jgi:Amt family ammonium transporter